MILGCINGGHISGIKAIFGLVRGYFAYSFLRVQWTNILIVWTRTWSVYISWTAFSSLNQREYLKLFEVNPRNPCLPLVPHWLNRSSLVEVSFSYEPCKINGLEWQLLRHTNRLSCEVLFVHLLGRGRGRRLVDTQHQRTKSCASATGQL